MSGIDRREEQLFVEALEFSGSARVAYLDEHCSDELLRGRVEELLALHDSHEGVLDRPTVRAVAGDYLPEELGAGDFVGPYELLEEIGAGGMGIVFRAIQHQPWRREVALKLIKPGMDTRSVVARFEGERQALALLDHPCITKVLDGGATERGRPYFVMELCAGQAITRYCEIRELDLESRLRLFEQLCETVEHAHQKGILHRDLKPSNVLVTEVDGVPTPKIIDFGIAKALSSPSSGDTSAASATAMTFQGQLLGTPEYMSPEQCTHLLDVDTRSDVYSLGVILCELLTGVTPTRHLGNDLDAIRDFVLNREIPKPSLLLQRTSRDLRNRKSATLIRSIQGELDWIVCRALATDREQRYQSAADLGRDIGRYRVGDAIEAAAPTVGYRLRKLYQRHRTATWVAASFALVVTTCAVVSTVLAFQLEDSLRAVERERDRAVDAEQRLSQMERKQRQRAAHFQGLAKYVSTSLSSGVEHFLQSTMGPHRHLVVAGDETLVRMIAEIEGEPLPKDFGGADGSGEELAILGLDDICASFDWEGIEEVSTLIELDTLPTWNEIPDAMVPFILESQRQAFGADDPWVMRAIVEIGERPAIRATAGIGIKVVTQRDHHELTVQDWDGAIEFQDLGLQDMQGLSDGLQRLLKKLAGERAQGEGLHPTVPVAPSTAGSESRPSHTEHSP